MMAIGMGRNRKLRQQRHGGAVVEFAVCIPVLMLIVLGSIEATSAIFLKESLNAAAYEGIREAASNKSTSATAKALAEAVIAARQIKGATITFSPADVQSIARGSDVRVTISAPIRGNSPFIGNVISDRALQVQAVMVKE